MNFLRKVAQYIEKNPKVLRRIVKAFEGKGNKQRHKRYGR